MGQGAADSDTVTVRVFALPRDNVGQPVGWILIGLAVAVRVTVLAGSVR